MIIARQLWEDLLFVHWKVDLRDLEPVVPKELDIDTFEGDAYVTLVSFRIRHSRPPFVPARLAQWIPASEVIELNFRTYVRGPAGDPGVWFFSLDASSRLFVTGARTVYSLPYYFAEMSFREVEGWHRFGSIREVGRGAARFHAKYRGSGEVFSAEPGTLEHFLVERYVLFAMSSGELSKARVEHEPYSLRTAEVDAFGQTVTDVIGLQIPSNHGTEPPRYVERLDVGIHAPRRV